MIRKLTPFILLALFAVGCKSGDQTAADNSATTTPATTPAATTPATTADNSQNSVVGTWTNDDKEEITDALVEFKADGTMTMSGTTVNPKGAKIDATGTWKLDKDKLTVNPTSMKITAPEGADEATKKQIEEGNKAASAPDAFKGAGSTDTIAWKDKDTFTLTSEKVDPATKEKKPKVVTFTRKAA